MKIFLVCGFTVTAAVDNDVWFYNSNGDVLASSNDWTRTTVVDYGDSCVIPVKLRNENGPMGFILSTDHGFVSDSTWKCTETEHADWFTLDFDDSTWEDATLYGRHSDGPWNGNFGPDPISTDALWIWTDSPETSDQTIYCRKNTCLSKSLRLAYAWNSFKRKAFKLNFSVLGLQG